MSTSSHMNYRYLDSSEKTEHMKAMRKDNRALEMKMKRLEAKLAVFLKVMELH